MAFIPMEMQYLLLHEAVVEDTHSGISSGGMAAPQGTMPRFLHLLPRAVEAFQMNSETFSII